MFKKIGVLALLAGSIGMALTPAAAYAQDGYYGRGGYGYYDHRDRDRDWDRHERHEWREREEARRAEAWREQQWRQQEWREHEWRERQRYDRGYYNGYQPGASFYFGYGR